MSDAAREACGPVAIATPSIDYVQEWNPGVHAKVRSRFKRDIDALAALGFRELAFYGEQFGLFSTIISFPMFVLMLLKREVMTFERGLRVRASFALMSHSDPATVCVSLALGVKFYTGFTDRTLLISTNFPSCAAPDQPANVLKHWSASKVAIADAWAAHQQRVRALEAQGKRIHESLGFDYYVEVSRQEQNALS